MKRTFSAVLALCLCAVFIFAFVACNSSNPDGGYMPPPEGGENAPDEDTPTADIAMPTPNERQTVLLWNENNVPAYNESSQRSSADDDDFIPYIESYPAQGRIKGAVLICPGGAFQFRSMRSEGYDVAERLSAYGYQCFVVSYRLRPYSQEVSALDLARAVRYVRSNAQAYGIDEDDIAVVGFSAGGILCGELLLHSDGYLLPTEIDENYISDSLDYVSAEASAIGHIYSFYGRLSVSDNNVETLRAGKTPTARTIRFTASLYAMRMPCARRACLWKNMSIRTSDTVSVQEMQDATGSRASMPF